MPEKVGTQNLKKVLDVVLEMGNASEDMLRGGQSLMQRLSHISQMFDEFMALTSVKYHLLDDEAKNLDDAEKAELIQHMKMKFDLDNDELEAKIEAGVSIAAKLGSALSESISWAKSLKSSQEAQGQDSQA